MADLAEPELNKYNKILGDVRFREFKRAVGLISHGVGIGAFVYLRRIFEGLIEDAYLIAKQKSGWNEEEYQRSKIDQKIDMLRDYLPSFLVKHKGLYSIMSMHIHELSEDECKVAFPVVKGGIELILDEKIREKEQAEKERKISSSIGKIHQELGEKVRKVSVKKEGEETG